MNKMELGHQTSLFEYMRDYMEIEIKFNEVFNAPMGVASSTLS